MSEKLKISDFKSQINTLLDLEKPETIKLFNLCGVGANTGQFKLIIYVFLLTDHFFHLNRTLFKKKKTMNESDALNVFFFNELFLASV